MAALGAYARRFRLLLLPVRAHLLRRGRVDTYPPFFLEHFLSSTDSGRVWRFKPWSGLRVGGKNRGYISESRTIRGRDFRALPDSRSGLILGESVTILKAKPSFRRSVGPPPA